ncbi:MAG: DnaA/Hda family protein [Alphaproteobacteria bacterium]|nr:DnaA/Hda family protein [Alphaproteobacteria bacterium]
MPSHNLKQIPMDFGGRMAHGRNDFQIGRSNFEAVGWIDRWPEWPAPVLILSGPPASGKSHLSVVWQDISDAVSIAPEMLSTQTAETLFHMGENLIIDGIDPWLGDRAAETTLFHLYNMLKEERHSIMITMRMSLRAVEFALPDLASRLRAAPCVSIHPPDDILLASVMIKLFSDRQLTMPQEVIAYVLPRMERSFSAAQQLVEYTDKLALSERRRISVPLMRKVLNDIQQAEL